MTSPMSAPDNPLAVLTLIGAPAVFTNASSVLVLGTGNRLARVVDRTRYLAQQPRNENDRTLCQMYYPARAPGKKGTETGWRDDVFLYRRGFVRSRESGFPARRHAGRDPLPAFVCTDRCTCFDRERGRICWTFVRMYAVSTGDAISPAILARRGQNYSRQSSRALT